MGKNNRLIKQCKAMYQQIQNTTPNIYASVAIALHRSGMDFDGIEEIFALSQEIWTECVQFDVDMLQMCFDETGIDVQRKVDEKKWIVD